MTEDHICKPLLDESGGLIAVVRGAPDMSAETLGHIREVVEAAKRWHASLPEEVRAEMGRRQELARERNRERLERIRKARGGT